MNQVIIFTDGSARGNPGPGGWGAIVASDDVVKEIEEDNKKKRGRKKLGSEDGDPLAPKDIL